MEAEKHAHVGGSSLRLDELDRRIVALLLDDARASYTQIGGRVGLSAPAVKRRVDRLRAAGVITGFAAVVDPAVLGWGTEAFVEIDYAGPTAPREIHQRMRRLPEVAAAYTITGEADALLHLRTRDISHLEQVLERIRADRRVAHTKTLIVLSRLLERPTGPAVLS